MARELVDEIRAATEEGSASARSSRAAREPGIAAVRRPRQRASGCSLCPRRGVPHGRDAWTGRAATLPAGPPLHASGASWSEHFYAAVEPRPAGARGDSGTGSRPDHGSEDHGDAGSTSRRTWPTEAGARTATWRTTRRAGTLQPAHPRGAARLDRAGAGQQRGHGLGAGPARARRRLPVRPADVGDAGDARDPGARRIRLFSDTGAWKQTALRVALFSQPTPEYPITLLQDHPDALLTATRETASHPIAAHPEWDLGS